MGVSNLSCPKYNPRSSRYDPPPRKTTSVSSLLSLFFLRPVSSFSSRTPTSSPSGFTCRHTPSPATAHHLPAGAQVPGWRNDFLTVLQFLLCCLSLKSVLSEAERICTLPCHPRETVSSSHGRTILACAPLPNHLPSGPPGNFTALPSHCGSSSLISSDHTCLLASSQTRHRLSPLLKASRTQWASWVWKTFSCSSF